MNEFRSFFGLKTHDSFESINPDPEISDLLRKLYDSPDMVELYPGLFVEDAKPRMDPGSGFMAPYTVGRAVLSDAVTLVRGDRFNTLVSILGAHELVDAEKSPKGLHGRKIDAMGNGRSPAKLRDNGRLDAVPSDTPRVPTMVQIQFGVRDAANVPTEYECRDLQAN